MPELPDEPVVMLQTDEGRVGYEGPLALDVVPQIRAALDAEFGADAA